MRDRRLHERGRGTTIRNPFDLERIAQKRRASRSLHRSGDTANRSNEKNGNEAERYGSSDATSSIWIATYARAATAL
ncbi:hypothetical protein BBJ41_33795 [Burkholderia stabilis]|nr:hypothetical protein BBJ41_33795 [Burkholderia stabilis]